jgi:uncharacterized membrane protein YeaQ/YmgE (transglycosylase-associated protein family)
MTLDQIVIILLVGVVAGFLASHVMSGRGYGLFGDLVVGILGALLGSWLFAKLGVVASGLIGEILVAFIGALILIAVLRLATGSGRGWGRRRRTF